MGEDVQPAWHKHDLPSLHLHSGEPCHSLWGNVGSSRRDHDNVLNQHSISNRIGRSNTLITKMTLIKAAVLARICDAEGHYYPALLRIKISNSYYVEMLSWNRSVGRSLSEIFGGSPPYQSSRPPYDLFASSYPTYKMITTEFYG